MTVKKAVYITGNPVAGQVVGFDGTNYVPTSATAAASYLDTTDNPVGLWKLDANPSPNLGSGGSALDISSGATCAFTFLLPGLKGWRQLALEELDSVAANSAPLRITGAITIECIVLLEDGGSDQNFVALGGIPDNALYEFGITSKGKFRYYAEHGTRDSTGSTYTSGVACVPYNRTCHVAMTRDATGTTVKFYLDGKLLDTATGLTAPDDSVGAGTSTIRMGVNHNGSNGLQGAMATPRITASEKNATQILAAYNGALGGVYGKVA